MVPHNSRLASLAELDARIAQAEAVAARHARLVALVEKGSDEARRASGFLRVAQERLGQLVRSRDVLLGDDEGVEDLEIAEVGGRRAASA
jgi:hypothetical protein